MQLPKNQLANILTNALKLTERGPNMGKHIFREIYIFDIVIAELYGSIMPDSVV